MKNSLKAGNSLKPYSIIYKAFLFLFIFHLEIAYLYTSSYLVPLLAVFIFGIPSLSLLDSPSALAPSLLNG
jgi:hypothetical protein